MRRVGAGLAIAVLAVAVLAVTVGAGTPAQQPGQPPNVNDPRFARAIFAGGCFWCMEPPFDVLDGVVATISGYTGGQKKDPTYEEVSSGTTGHAESVMVLYDPAKVTYEKLVDVFWHNVDPFTANRQFCDSGSQYRSAIFYVDEEQHRIAEASKRALEASGRFKQPIVTQIAPASAFYRAEDYNQDYYRKNPLQYKFYRFGCGRDRVLERIWGKTPS